MNVKDEETKRLQEEVEDARRRQEEATAALRAATTTPEHQTPPEHHVLDMEHEENDDLSNGEVGQWSSEGSIKSSETSFYGLTSFANYLSCLTIYFNSFVRLARLSFPLAVSFWANSSGSIAFSVRVPWFWTTKYIKAYIITNEVSDILSFNLFNKIEFGVFFETNW